MNLVTRWRFWVWKRDCSRVEALRWLLTGMWMWCALVGVGGCGRSPFAPGGGSVGAIRVGDYLVPAGGVVALDGAHPLTIRWTAPVLTLDKGATGETWTADAAAGWWRHSGDSSAPGQSPYRLVEGDQDARWLPLVGEAGQTWTIWADILQDGTRRPFPYEGTIVGVEGDELVTTYEPLHADGRRHAAARETYRFRRGVGLVAWKAQWHGDVWLHFAPVP